MKLNKILLNYALAFLSTGMSPAQAEKRVELSDDQIENIVKRSYQYVAMYNVNQKLALA